MTDTTDFNVQNEGSIFILNALTPRASLWCAEHLPHDATRWGNGYVIEPRYIEPIVDGIVDDGLTIE
jgi:hypothetical protein